MNDLNEVLEHLLGGQTILKCPNCDEYIMEEDVVEVRECSNRDCGEIFNSTENGRNCESCNRPFTRILTRKGCPDCLEESECEAFSLDEFEKEFAELELNNEERKEADEKLDKLRAVLKKIVPIPIFKSRTDHIRWLAYKGMSRSEIAEKLGVRYQVVRSALIGRGN